MIDTRHYPPSRKYDVNEEYADAERALTEAWHDLCIPPIHGKMVHA